MEVLKVDTGDLLNSQNSSDYKASYSPFTPDVLRERDRDRQRETDRQRQTETDRQTETERERERERGRQTDRNRTEKLGRCGGSTQVSSCRNGRAVAESSVTCW